MAMSLLMVLSVVLSHELTLNVKADAAESLFCVGNSTTIVTDEDGNDIEMGKILVKMSDDSDWTDISSESETQSVSLPLGEVTVFLMCEPNDGYCIANNTFTVCKNNINDGDFVISETEYEIVEFEPIEITIDSEAGDVFSVEGLNFKALNEDDFSENDESVDSDEESIESAIEEIIETSVEDENELDDTSWDDEDKADEACVSNIAVIDSSLFDENDKTIKINDDSMFGSVDSDENMVLNGETSFYILVKNPANKNISSEKLSFEDNIGNLIYEAVYSFEGTTPCIVSDKIGNVYSDKVSVEEVFGATVYYNDSDLDEFIIYKVTVDYSNENIGEVSKIKTSLEVIGINSESNLNEMYFELVLFDSFFPSGTISDSDVTINVSAEYNPITKKPDYTCAITKVFDRKIVHLSEGRDYTIDYGYTSNDGTDIKAKSLTVGKSYYAKITGKGEITATRYKKYTYQKAEITDESVLYRNSSGEIFYDCTGKDIDFHPTVIVKGYTLVEGKDFVVSNYKPVKLPETTSPKANIKGIGNFEGTVDVKVHVNPIDFSKVTVKLDKTSMKWDDSDPVEVVSFNGLVLQRDVDYFVQFDKVAGVSEFRVITKAEGVEASTTRKIVKVNVGAKYNISKAKVSVSERTYNGEFQTTGVAVYVNNQKIDSKYYEVEYVQNPVNAGTYKIVVNGKANRGCIGSATGKFVIKPRKIKEDDCSSSSAVKYINSKTLAKPIVNVNVNDIKLEEGVDYTITYGKVNQAGKDNTVTIQAKGNYTGKVTLNYRIEQKEIKYVVAQESVNLQIYAKEKSQKTLNVDCRLTDLKYGTDYIVELTGDVGSNSSGVIKFESEELSSSALPITVKYLGIGNYTGEETCMFFVSEIDCKQLSACTCNWTEPSYTFTGEPIITRVIKFKDGTKTLNSNFEVATNDLYDYSLTYSNNINVGTATVTANGANGYSGNISKKFKITPANPVIVNIEVAVGEYPYVSDSGKVVIPKFTLTYGNYTLRQNVDYTYKIKPYKLEPYADIYAEITYKGNFMNVTRQEFLGKLQPINIINDDDLTFVGKEFTYTGKDIKPTSVLSYCGPASNNKKITLKEGVDFTVKYVLYGDDSGRERDAMREIGAYRIKIRGTGKYYMSSADYSDAIVIGGYESVYKVLPADIKKASVSLNKTSYNYERDIASLSDEQAKKLLIDNIKSVKLGNIDVPSSDYVLTVEGYNKPGTATLKFEGIHSYTGTIVKTVAIDGKVSINDSDVKVTWGASSARLTPGGARLNPTIKYKGVVLELNKDYKIEYKNNTKLTSVSGLKATATVKGIGKYYGTYNEVKQFTVSKGNLIDIFEDTDNLSSDALKVYESDFILYDVNMSQNAIGSSNEWVYVTTYTGRDITVDPKLKWYGKPLVLGKDYTINYWDSKLDNYDSKVRNSGVYFCKIEGTGNYSGKSGGYFILVVMPADINKLSVSAKETYYTGEVIEPKITARFNGVTLSSDDYDWVLVKDYSIDTVPVLGGGFYKWAAKQFKLPNKEISYSFSEDSDTEFKDAGTYTILISSDNFGGCKIFKYNIKGIDINKAKFNSLKSVEYGWNDDALTYNTIIGYYNGMKLQNGKDYELSVDSSSFTPVGKGTVYVNGKGHFSGTKKLTYTITPKLMDEDGENDSVTIKDISGDHYYTGKAITPDFEVVYDMPYSRKPLVLVKGRDYTVSYSNNVNIGVPTAAISPIATITFKGNYKGKLTKKFSIKPPTVTSDDIVVNNVKAGAYKSVPIIIVNGKKLENGKDFTCEYKYASTVYVKRNGALTAKSKDTVVSPKDVVPAGTQLNVYITITNENYANYNVKMHKSYYVV